MLSNGQHGPADDHYQNEQEREQIGPKEGLEANRRTDLQGDLVTHRQVILRHLEMDHFAFTFATKLLDMATMTRLMLGKLHYSPIPFTLGDFTKM